MASLTSVISLLCLCLISWTTCTSAYKVLDDAFLRLVPAGAADLDINTGALLAPLLTARTAGSAGHTAAQRHFINFFHTSLPKWAIDWQNSTGGRGSAGAAAGSQNLIFRREPPWTKPGQANILTLAAHYDSRAAAAGAPSGGSVGAVESAVSCAVLMHVARSIDRYLTQMHDEMDALGEGGEFDMDMGVQVAFLDRREGQRGQGTGLRSLAEAWEAVNPALSNYRTPLNQISMFVPVDLIGSANTMISSYFETSHWAYRGLANIESRMRNLGLLQSNVTRPIFNETGKSAAQFVGGPAQGDYFDFLSRGVPTMPIIPPTPPVVWKTPQDDGQHLDAATVQDWSKIMTAFALEWLDMMEVAPTNE